MRLPINFNGKNPGEINVQFIDADEQGVRFEANFLGKHEIIFAFPNKASETIQPLPTIDPYFEKADHDLRILEEKSKNSNWITKYFMGEEDQIRKIIKSSRSAIELAKFREGNTKSVIEKMERKLRVSCVSAGALGASITLLLSYLYSQNIH